MHRIVLTNGCFDILHIGHVRLLNYAKSLGSELIVGLNSDESIKRIKGINRPINNQNYRCEMLYNLISVDKVIIFDEDNCVNLLKKICPDIYVKGGDYNIHSINFDERFWLDCLGVQTFFSPQVPNVSTTNIINSL